MSSVMKSFKSGLSSKALPVFGLAIVLAGCGGGLLDGGSSAPATQTSTGSSLLGGLFGGGTATRSADVESVSSEDEPTCPAVSIAPGGAALRVGGGTSEAVRSQVTITDVARECARAPDGGVTMRVGAEGRVLVGPAGASGALGATMRIEVRRGDQVVTTRSVRVGASIPGGQAQAGWVHVEQGIVVPGSALRSGADVDVFVTLNAGAPTARRNRS